MIIIFTPLSSFSTAAESSPMRHLPSLVKLAAFLTIGLCGPANAQKGEIEGKPVLPDDQKEFVKKLDTLAAKDAALRKQLRIVKNALRRNEYAQELSAVTKEVKKELEKKVTKDGFVDWFASVESAKGNVKLKTALKLAVSQGVFLSVSLDGQTDEAKKVIRDLKDGDKVRLTLEADEKAVVYDGVTVEAVVSGKSITSIEKLKVK